jgi:isopentenyldiphosphate isomerase
MADEVYDVVDETGNKIGTATWTEVHAKGLLHQCVSALVFKDTTRSETLLQKRSQNMSQNPGLWQHAAGGHVLAGQSVEQGIRTELQEELFAGHELPDFEIKKVGSFFNHDMPNNKEILNLFEVTYPGPFYFDDKELAEPPTWIRWTDLLKDLKDNPNKYTPVFHTIIKFYLPFYGR